MFKPACPAYGTPKGYYVLPMLLSFIFLSTVQLETNISERTRPIFTKFSW